VVQLKEKVLQRQQGSYILTVEAGRQLLLSADSRAELALQTELTDIQERWRHASVCLDEQRKELATLLRVNRTRCHHLHYRCRLAGRDLVYYRLKKAFICGFNDE